MSRTRKYYFLAFLGALPLAILAAPVLRTNPYSAVILADLTGIFLLAAGYQLGARTQNETYDSANLTKIFNSRSDNENSKDS